MRLRELIFKINPIHLRYKIFNIIKYFVTRKLTLNKVHYQPLRMDIEPTTGCNFRCTMCAVSSPNFTAKNMNFETFKKIIDQNKQLLNIKLQGMGEPFVNKHLFEMISYANNYGIAVELISNGSLINKDYVKKISGSFLSRISISIDGATNETFEKIRVRSNFEIVKKNVLNLISSLKLNQSRPELRALSLIQTDNFHEISDIADLCYHMGFDNLYYQVQLTGWGKTDWEIINKKKNIELKKIKNTLNAVIEKYKYKNFKIGIIEDNLLNFEKKCSYPYETPYISAKGKIVPCCMIADDKVINFGDINDEKFSTIWNSNKVKDFRKNIKNNNLEDYCKNCYKEYRN
jgi:pyrroloquinoline quinone biosynthesis protein E